MHIRAILYRDLKLLQAAVTFARFRSSLAENARQQDACKQGDKSEGDRRRYRILEDIEVVPPPPSCQIATPDRASDGAHDHKHQDIRVRAAASSSRKPGKAVSGQSNTSKRPGCSDKPRYFSKVRSRLPGAHFSTCGTLPWTMRKATSVGGTSCPNRSAPPTQRPVTATAKSTRTGARLFGAATVNTPGNMPMKTVRKPKP